MNTCGSTIVPGQNATVRAMPTASTLALQGGAMTGLATSAPPGVYLPYLAEQKYQRICLSPPFATANAATLDCFDTIATMAGCYFDSECLRPTNNGTTPQQGTCQEGVCMFR